MRRNTVPALHLSAAPHRLVVGATAGRLRAEQRYEGRGAPLKLREVPRPARPPGWVRVAPVLAGVCASDRKTVQLAIGRPLLAFTGLPREGIVLGHEVVGTVVDADADAPVRPGDRVVPEPLLACRHKGFPACDRCTVGDEHRCAHQADAGTAAPGLGFGFHARFGGGWSTELVVPADRVHPVPDHLDDRTALLAEPTAVGVHAVLRDAPRAGERAAVIGPGTIGLSTVHALRVLAPEVEVTVVGLDPTCDGLARRAGAHRYEQGKGRRLVESLGRSLDTVVRGNGLSGPVLEDGFDVVVDTVGSEVTVDAALRVLRPGGRLVMLATAARLTVDWSLVWHRELRVHGSGYAAVEDVPAGLAVPAGRRRALAIALEVLAETRPAHLVTHVFPLEQVRDALVTSEAGPAAGAVKVAFAPTVGRGQRPAGVHGPQ